MNTSDAIDAIAAALAKAQGEIQNPTKNKTNPHFRSSYADLAGGLDTIRPTLAKHGLSVVQMTHLDGDMVTLHTRVLHTSGQWLESVYPVCRTTKHQEMGSALTYARRYALFAMIGVAGEEDDDDGNTAATARGKAPAAPAATKSSYAVKKDTPNAWGDMEKAARACTSIDALTTLWDETDEEAKMWPQAWQRERWQLFEDCTKDLQQEAAE